MNFSDVLKRAGKFTTDNSPAILTAIAVAGVATTTYLTAKASFKAVEILRKESSENPLTGKEIYYLTWKLYLPAAGSAAATIVAIVLANRIGTRRAAALAAVYAVSERTFAEYKDKVIEKIGENKEREIRDEVAQDRVTARPVSEMIVIGAGSVLCFETFTGRYFLSDMESLRKAQNDLNFQVQNDYYASLTDFYRLINLPQTDYSDEVGWNSDKLLELDFSTTLTEDGRPCLAISYKVTPIRNFYRLS